MASTYADDRTSALVAMLEAWSAAEPRPRTTSPRARRRRRVLLSVTPQPRPAAAP